MGAIKINGDTSGSTTITAPATGSDETIELSTTLASKVDYPSGGSDGDALIKSGSSAAWGAAGGLILLEHFALSGSSVSVDNVFSTTYRAYRVIVYVTASSGNASMNVRVRASGSDLTTSTYVNQTLDASTTTVTAAGPTQANLYAGTGTTATEKFAILDVLDIAHTRRTILTGLVGSASQVTALRTLVNNTTAYDGLTVFPSSGTITAGFGSIYGYLE